jgi:methylglutaconyl-CoA hydratase
MSYPGLETLEVERRGNGLHVRLNRPKVRNAFNGQVVIELAATFANINSDDATRVVVLSGNGKSFSAGADLGWMKQQAELPEAENAAGAAEMAGMFLNIARCTKPVVAKIHGHALGGGSGLTAAVDIAICARDTMFGLTEVKLGIVPAEISPFVMQKIGIAHARVLFLTGERFDGCEAERIGLVHRAVCSEDLEGEVERVVGELCSSGPAAVDSAKKLIGAIASYDLEAAIPITSEWIANLRATPEAKEGMSAFLEKRKANWF